jgi:arabinose-5-phosphate isomerase
MIKSVIFDFDGVFTDGKCCFDANDNIIKYYNVKDGMALSLLKQQNIKVGLISSYNTKKEIKLNEKNIDGEIINHLKFDFYYVGERKKMDVLNEFIKSENIHYNEIAYIGDDINDIEIMSKVAFSACPSDAVEKCKNVANYVCEKRGGDGCVREFVEKILELKENNKICDIIKKIKIEANYQLGNFDTNKISFLVDMIRKSETIYFTGIGKSENIAIHCVNLLKSIGYRAFYLNAINSIHGDIGTVRENDLVILFSKSGNTAELLDLITFLDRKKCITIGIHCDDNSKFQIKCKHSIKIPFNNETEGEIDKIPTNSYMSQMFLCNILASILKENISKEEYKENHPAGNIGKCMKIIKECMIYDYPKFKINDKISMHDVLLEMTKYKIGCSFFVSENDELIGILTDGDIRRILVDDENRKYIKYDDINKNYYYEIDLNKYISDCGKYYTIPILKDKKITGILHNFLI